MKKNPIAITIQIIGYLALTTGILLYLYYSFSDDFDSLGSIEKITVRSFGLSTITWGIIFLGFAEIISLLQGIYIVQRKIAGIEDDKANHLPTVSFTYTKDGSKMSPIAKRELIYNHYSDKGIKIDFDKIEISQEENICFVEINGEKITVDISGEMPKEVSMSEMDKL